jgi:hypothetical protein
MKKLIITSAALIMATNIAIAADASQQITSREYVDSGLSQKANKSQVGNDALTTTAQTITAAVNELNTALDAKLDSTDVAGMATQAWVTSQNYLTTTAVDDKQDKLTCTAGQVIQYDSLGAAICADVVAGPYTEL